MRKLKEASLDIKIRYSIMNNACSEGKSFDRNDELDKATD